MSAEREAIKRVLQENRGHLAFFPLEWKRFPLDVKEKPVVDETALERHRLVMYGSSSPRNKYLLGAE